MVQLKTDVDDLRKSLREMEQRMQAAIDGLGLVVREGFADVGKALDRFAVHLDAHTEVLGELTAKVNEHEDRIAALESKQ